MGPGRPGQLPVAHRRRLRGGGSQSAAEVPEQQRQELQEAAGDIGCGEGYLLRLHVTQSPYC